MVTSALLLLAGAGAAFAQEKEWGTREKPRETETVRIEKISCGLCDEKLERVTYSVSEYERDTDFKVIRASLNAYPHVLLTCPKCSYTNYSFQIHKPVTEEQRKIIRDSLVEMKREFAGVWAVPLSYTVRAAAAIQKALEGGAGILFEIYLLGSYMARDAGEKEAEREMQRRAVTHLVVAIEKEEAYQKPKMRYLVGELYRRLESYKEALEWFSRARVGAEEDMLALIGRQEIATRDALDKKDRPPKK